MRECNQQAKLTGAIYSNFIAPCETGLKTMERAYLAVEDGVIRSLSQEKPRDLPVINHSEGLFLPGLCDMHVHAPQFAQRGLGLDLELLPWLDKYTFPQESRFADETYARLVYRAFSRALIQNGTTRACVFATIHLPATLILMEELENAGVEAYVGKVNMDRNGGEGLQETTERSLEDTRLWLLDCARFTTSRPILTPRFAPSCTDALLSALGEYQGLPVQSHLNENRGEIKWVQELFPQAQDYLGVYERFGLLGNRTLMAHCVHMTEGELARMARLGATAVHCPESNINLASGMADVGGLLKAGVKVMLGSDVAGGASINMLDAVRAAVSVSKLAYAGGGGPCLSVPRALELCCGQGGAFFGSRGPFMEGELLHGLVLEDKKLFTPRPLSLQERLERMVYLPAEREIAQVYSMGVPRLPLCG